MDIFMREQTDKQRMTLAIAPTCAKALATCIIITLAFGMIGALGQIFVHDIIPTFYAANQTSHADSPENEHGAKTGDLLESTPESSRGDLLSDLATMDAAQAKKTLYQNEQFVWALKWTHIHLFGMNMIFILMGTVTIFLDTSAKSRTWLIVLPFVGVFIDNVAMRLKLFISPVFFWLHVPGGGIFAVVFGYVSIRALWEMWVKPRQQEPI